MSAGSVDQTITGNGDSLPFTLSQDANAQVIVSGPVSATKTATVMVKRGSTDYVPLENGLLETPTAKGFDISGGTLLIVRIAGAAGGDQFKVNIS